MDAYKTLNDLYTLFSDRLPALVGGKTPVTATIDDTKFPAGAALQDAAVNPTATKIGAYLKVFNGASWDRIRAGATAVSSTFTGFIATLPWSVYKTTPTVRTDGQGGPLLSDANGNLKIASGQLPTALGATTGAGSVSIVPATDAGMATSAAQATAITALTAVARTIVVDAQAMTRPANQTPYSIGDAVSNDGTAAAVAAISWTVSDTNDAPVVIRRIRIATPDTGPGTAGATFRIYLYRSDPTASSGVVGGDNAAFSTKQGTFLGSFVGTFRSFSDGSVATCVPEDGADLMVRPTSGARTLYALVQTLTAFTSSANSTTFTLTLEAFQGRQ